MMGGIVTDLQARSTLPGLYAVGESSCTGLHGANRLASNSLSECFVFARRAVADALAGSAGALLAPATTRARGPGELARAARGRRRTPARRCGATAGSCAAEEGLRRLLETPHPLARLIARCALARRRAGARTCAPNTPSAIRRSITGTRVLDAEELDLLADLG